MMKSTIEKLLQQYEKYNLSEVIDYDKFNNYAIVHHSSTIEGSTLSETETRLLLEENLTPKGKPLEHSLMTKDHYLALQFILRMATAKRPISPEFIQETNALVMKNTGGTYNTAFGTINVADGMFRKGNVRAGDSYSVNYDKVEVLVKNLAGELNARLAASKTRIEALEISFVAHFHLVTIHPFYDGNGSTSRLLMNYIQKVSGLPLGIVYAEDKIDYFNALQENRKQDDIAIFKAFMNGQYEKYLKNEIERYKRILPEKGKDTGKGKDYYMMF